MDSANSPMRFARHGTGAATPEDEFRRIAHAYVDFARDNPALYDAMFTRATTLHFAADDTPAALSTAFAGLRCAVAAISAGAERRHHHRSRVGSAARTGDVEPQRSTAS